MERKMAHFLKGNQSKENTKRMEPFIQMEKKYSLLAKQYADAFDELYAKVLQEEHRKEYAKGGQSIHRGVYSPSSLDVITGGCNRGRLLKRLPREGNYDYVYTFDEKGNLICSKYSEGIEILIRKENCVLGLEFDHSAHCLLERISECWYEDAKLVKYVCAVLNHYDEGKSCTEINVETFDYANDVLEKVNWYRYSPAIKLLTHEEITLYRDEAGNLHEYAVQEFDLPSFIEPPGIPEQRFKARKNEKVFHDTHRMAEDESRS